MLISSPHECAATHYVTDLCHGLCTCWNLWLTGFLMSLCSDTKAQTAPGERTVVGLYGFIEGLLDSIHLRGAEVKRHASLVLLWK